MSFLYKKLIGGVSKTINIISSLIPVKRKKDIKEKAKHNIKNKKRKMYSDAINENSIKRISLTNEKYYIIGELSLLSFTTDKVYKINPILQDDKLYFKCNCGVQFGVGNRFRCKHIAWVINSIHNNFWEKSKEKSKISNDLISSLEELSLTTFDEKNERIISNFKICFNNEQLNKKYYTFNLIYNSEKEFFIECLSSSNKIFTKQLIKNMLKIYRNLYNNPKYKKYQNKKDMKLLLNFN